MNVYTVEGVGMAYYIEASRMEVAARRGIRAINRGRKEKGWIILDQMDEAVIKIRKEQEGITLPEFLGNK